MKKKKSCDTCGRIFKDADACVDCMTHKFDRYIPLSPKRKNNEQ
jgi:hypothetical protein